MKKSYLAMLIAAVVAIALAVAVAITGGSANAAGAWKMITGGDIKNNTIQSRDVHNGTLTFKDFKKSAVKKLHGAQGPAGVAGPQGPVGPVGPSGDSRNVYVASLGGLFAAHAGDEAGLTLTGDGVQFGPFANGAACDVAGQDYARLDFHGLDGKTLSQVSQLDYNWWDVSSDNTGGVGSMTLRITLANGDRLTYSPNTQYNTPADYNDAQGTVNTALVTHGTLRLNDDSGDNPAGELPYAHWAGAEGSQTITKVDFLNGCQNGTNLQGLVLSVSANGTHYVLGKN